MGGPGRRPARPHPRGDRRHRGRRPCREHEGLPGHSRAHRRAHASGVCREPVGGACDAVRRRVRYRYRGGRRRLRSWLANGTTTIEAKTGYHLTRDGELADVRLLRSLEREPGMPHVHVTFLAAHAIPPEYFGRRRDYVDAACSWSADAAVAGADSVDVYCDEGRFTEEETRWVLGAGRAAGLLPRMHACGDARTGSARLA